MYHCFCLPHPNASLRHCNSQQFDFAIVPTTEAIKALHLLHQQHVESAPVKLFVVPYWYIADQGNKMKVCC